METFGKNTMNCEQVEAIVLDLDRDDLADPLERAAALAHVSHCPRCAALQESWQAAKEELRLLGEDTLEARAPARVEMRLRQEFRTRHRTLVAHRVAAIAAWTLAAAAVLIGAVGTWNWQHQRNIEEAKQNAAQNVLMASNASAPDAALAGGDDSAEFTPIPGTLHDESEEAAILRV